MFKFGAAVVFCLALTQALPLEAADTSKRVPVTNNMWYTQVTPQEYAFNNEQGCLYILERTGARIGTTYFDFHLQDGRDYETMYQAWKDFKGSKDTLQNAAYLQHSLKEMESAYTEEVANHCRLQLLDVADGTGKKPNHYDKFKVFNLVDGKTLLAAVATVNNDKSIEATIYGGPRWIKGTEVRVRAEANTACQVLGYFQDREEIEVLGYTKTQPKLEDPGDWAYVERPNGTRGYVAAQFVTTNGDVVDNFEEYLKNHLEHSGKYDSWKARGYKLGVTDTYSGEGPRAKSTMVIQVYEEIGNHINVLGVFHVCSDGRIMKHGTNDEGLVQDN